MIRATRVGQLPDAIPAGSAVCPRCGVTFDRRAQNVIPGAPCRDCRDVLRAEGDTTIWNIRRLRATA